MPRTTDAFGAALLDVLAGGDGRHAIERDDGRVGSMNATSYFATADTWTGEIVEALSQMHGRVLDVGCGAGRHALHAASLGCDVVGLEPSPGAIEVCRRRWVHAIRGRLGDHDLSLDGFDGVMMLGNNLGLPIPTTLATQPSTPSFAPSNTPS